jgi:hypothetical protein
MFSRHFIGLATLYGNCRGFCFWHSMHAEIWSRRAIHNFNLSQAKRSQFTPTILRGFHFLQLNFMIVNMCGVLEMKVLLE